MTKLSHDIRVFIYNIETDFSKQCELLESMSDKVEALENEIEKLNVGQLNTGQISDGHHTFDELYYHRMVLFSIICNQNSAFSWKSKLHCDGSMYPGYFIAGITTPEGEYTYHYEMKYWNKFNVRELESAPEWDGHQPGDIERLYSLFLQY